MLTNINYSNAKGSVVSVIKDYYTKDIYENTTGFVDKFEFTDKMFSGVTRIPVQAVTINNSNINDYFEEIYNTSTSVDDMVKVIENAKNKMKQYLTKSEKQIKEAVDSRFYRSDGYIWPALQSYISTCVSLSTQLVDAVVEIGIYWTNNSIKIIENVVRSFQKQII